MSRENLLAAAAAGGGASSASAATAAASSFAPTTASTAAAGVSAENSGGSGASVDPELFVALYDFQSGGDNQLTLAKGQARRKARQLPRIVISCIG